MTTPISSARKQRPSKLDPYLHLLGVQSDAQVAALAGLTPEAVRLYRKRRGIPSARDAAGAAEEALPPEPGEDEAAAAPAAAKASAPKASAANRGKRTKSGGKAKATVAAPVAPPAGRRGPRSKLDAVRELIGVLSDGDVAAKVGLTRSAVQMYRLKHGIAAAAPKGGRVRARPAPAAPEPAPAPVAPAPAAAAVAAVAAPSNARLVAWRLTLKVAADEVVRFAVAPDAAGAARLGEAAGEVAKIERLGDALG